MTVSYIALGSNLGDRVWNMAAALRELSADAGIHVLDVSRAVESEPWGVEAQPAFANAVARVDVHGQADAFLQLLKDVEVRLGRVAGERFGPRMIDLDILLFGDEEWDSAALTIPHLRMLERDFVVTPLLEIAPDITLPDGTPVDASRAVLGRVTGDLGPIPGFDRGR